MKISVKISGWMAVMMALTAARVPAQTFSVIHTFTNCPDGALPSADLTLSGTTLYGTTQGGGGGGSTGGGTVFQVNTDGTGYAVIQSFPVNDGIYPENGTGDPNTGVVLAGNTLYGTTYYSGGTLFKVNTNGTGYATLYNGIMNPAFVGGSYPHGDLLLNGGRLYACLYLTYGWESGEVFSFNTDGTDFVTIKTFSWTDSSGGYAPGPVVMSGATLYGMTTYGPGYINNGTIYKVNTNGTGYALLHAFNGSDGSFPGSRLVLNGSTLYGTTPYGGASGNGTVFQINTDGSGFNVLKSFSALLSNTNSDGANPEGLVLNGSTLYGTAAYGGISSNGTVFQINTDGLGFSVLKSFSALTNSTNSDGANPCAGLTLGGNTLYGTACNGGAAGCGTVFQIALAATAPSITNQPCSTSVASGSTEILSVGVGGTPPFSYQWAFNGTNLAVATNCTLVITNFCLADCGSYTVTVSNSAGTVTSQAAALFGMDIRMFAGLIINGPVGSNYLIQAAPTLPGSWTTLTNVALPAQPYIFIDYNSPWNARQFYRAVPQ